MRTDWKIGLFTEKKVRTEKQAKKIEGVSCILKMLKVNILLKLSYMRKYNESL